MATAADTKLGQVYQAVPANLDGTCTVGCECSVQTEHSAGPAQLLAELLGLVLLLLPSSCPPNK